jgi:hypothetical protein
MCIGLALLLFLQFALPKLTATETLPGGFKLAFPWLAVVGAGSTFFFGYMISLIAPQGTAT